MTSRTAVASVADFVEGTLRSFRVDGTDVVVGMADGQYFALHNRCPHAGSRLEGGTLSGCELMCPRHGALIDVRTGECVVPDGLPSISTYAVEVEAGRVYVLI